MRHLPHFAHREEKSKQVVAATSEANFDEGIGGKNDYSPLLSGQFESEVRNRPPYLHTLCRRL